MTNRASPMTWIIWARKTWEVRFVVENDNNLISALDHVINKELESMGTGRRSLEFSDQYSTDNSIDDLPSKK